VFSSDQAFIKQIIDLAVRIVLTMVARLDHPRAQVTTGRETQAKGRE